jgi:hypothetical protein
MTEEELEKEVARVIDHQTGYVYTDATTLYIRRPLPPQGAGGYQWQMMSNGCSIHMWRTEGRVLSTWLYEGYGKELPKRCRARTAIIRTFARKSIAPILSGRASPAVSWASATGA